jgi:hypothetical protein
LLWTLAPEIIGENAELQYVTGSLIREYDGIFKGQTSEPDVILLGTTGIAVIECKLSEPDKAPSHLWEGTVNRIGRRLEQYKEKNTKLLKHGVGDKEVAPVYQLVRMAFYATELALHYKVEPIIVSLSNERNWSIKASATHKSAADLWYMFLQLLRERAPRCECIFWQDLQKLINEPSMVTLSKYLSVHPCL